VESRHEHDGLTYVKSNFTTFLQADSCKRQNFKQYSQVTRAQNAQWTRLTGAFRKKHILRNHLLFIPTKIISGQGLHTNRDLLRRCVCEKPPGTSEIHEDRLKRKKLTRPGAKTLMDWRAGCTVQFVLALRSLTCSPSAKGLRCQVFDLRPCAAEPIQKHTSKPTTKVKDRMNCMPTYSSKCHRRDEKRDVGKCFA
jgi:hypothetical protein